MFYFVVITQTHCDTRLRRHLHSRHTHWKVTLLFHLSSQGEILLIISRIMSKPAQILIAYMSYSLSPSERFPGASLCSSHARPWAACHKSILRKATSASCFKSLTCLWSSARSYPRRTNRTGSVCSCLHAICLARLVVELRRQSQLHVLSLSLFIWQRTWPLKGTLLWKRRRWYQRRYEPAFWLTWAVVFIFFRFTFPKKSLISFLCTRQAFN